MSPRCSSRTRPSTEAACSTNGVVDKLFSYDLTIPGIARVFAEQADTADCVLIAQAASCTGP